jgi:hypothetical protein
LKEWQILLSKKKRLEEKEEEQSSEREKLIFELRKRLLTGLAADTRVFLWPRISGSGIRLKQNPGVYKVLLS